MPIPINWVKVLKLANLTEKEFDKLALDKTDLTNIYNDFKLIKGDLDSLALYFVTKILTFPRVHSVRYRIKDPEHLVAKIVRKKIENNDRLINFETYKEEVTDLIGIRILHLFKNEYSVIDRNLRKNFQISPTYPPIIYKRVGDIISSRKPFDSFEIKDHPRNYRSVHYILESTPTKNKYYVEVQVRTIFEEGWSEIDHKILYPDNLSNAILNEFSMILNSLAGSADSMATQMKGLKMELESITEEHESEISEKDKKIKSLEALINKSNLKNTEKSEIIDAIEAKDNLVTRYKSISEILNSSSSNNLLYKFSRESGTNKKE